MNKEEQLVYMDLFRAELRHLTRRGWQALCGTQDAHCMVAPGDNYIGLNVILYTHEEALKLQKEKDQDNARDNIEAGHFSW